MDNEMNFCRDASNAIRNINDLKHCVEGNLKKIRAQFKHDKKKVDADADPVDVNQRWVYAKVQYSTSRLD